MPDDTVTATTAAEFIRALPLAELAASPFNPRRAASAEADAALVDSIRRDGVLQPIVVRPISDECTQRLADVQHGARWQIIAGHRRAAAAEAAGVKLAPPAPKEESWKAAQAREAQARQEREAAAAAENLRRRLILDAVREQVRATPRSAFDLALVARVAYAGLDYDDVPRLAELWGEKDRRAMEAKIGQLGVEDLTRFVLDCALVRGAFVGPYDLHRRGEQPDPPLLLAAKHYGIDPAQFTVAPAEEKKPGKAKAKKAAKKARKAKTEASA